MFRPLLATVATSIALSAVAAHAGPPKWAPGHKNSAAHYAPGQVKKRHSAKHGHIHGGDWVRVEDYDRWGLKPPRDGHDYIRKDGKIYEVVKDTLAIIGAVAVVDALTN
jgi:Ni/Co efflux regulator RcnB